MNRHLTNTMACTQTGDVVVFRGSGRGSAKEHIGTLVQIVHKGQLDPDVLKKYPRSRIAFDPEIPGRNGMATHYLVDVANVLYRPNLSRIISITPF